MSLTTPRIITKILKLFFPRQLIFVEITARMSKLLNFFKGFVNFNELKIIEDAADGIVNGIFVV